MPRQRMKYKLFFAFYFKFNTLGIFT